MQRSIANGWDKFERGQDADAQRIFEALLKAGKNRDEARLGLAQVALRRGQLAQATQHVQAGLDLRATLELQATLGQVLGAKGQRREAEEVLGRVVEQRPNDALARAIYAEQIVRQGRWEEGTEQFILALSDDPSGLAFAYFTNVVSNLVEAFLAGRMPQKTAMQFINRVDYATPKGNREAGYFFGAVRRALNAQQPLEVPPFRGRPGAARAPAPASPARQTGRERRERTEKRESQNERFGRRRAQREAQQARRTSRRRSQPDAAPPAQPQVDPNQKDMKALIQQDRDLNQDLLSDLPDIPPAKWPSEANYTQIDTVPPIELRRDSLLGVSSKIDTRDFRVTTGKLEVEIFLERCLRNMMIATEQTKAVPLVGRPGSVWQMELNCLDGLLDTVEPPSELYQDLDDYEDYAALSLGFFLGNIPATLYGGVWTYKMPAEQSVVKIGDLTLNPFELVSDWLDADDKDDVHLDVMMRRAKLATQRSTSMIHLQNYIDPTAGLTHEAIATTLATLWTSYRFSLPEAAINDISRTAKLEEVSEHAIVFTLPRRWAPKYTAGPGGAALLKDERVALAYIRRSGEFVPMVSRKALAHLMEVSAAKLDEDSAEFALRSLVSFHRPGWRIAFDQRTAARLSEHAGRELSAPQLRASRGSDERQLEVWGISDSGPCLWRLLRDPAELPAWRLEFEQL